MPKVPHVGDIQNQIGLDRVLKAGTDVLYIGWPQLLVDGADHQLPNSRIVVERKRGQRVGRESVLQQEGWRYGWGGELASVDQERGVESQEALATLPVKSLVEESASPTKYELVGDFVCNANSWREPLAPGLDQGARCRIFCSRRRRHSSSLPP